MGEDGAATVQNLWYQECYRRKPRSCARQWGTRWRSEVRCEELELEISWCVLQVERKNRSWLSISILHTRDFDPFLFSLLCGFFRVNDMRNRYVSASWNGRWLGSGRHGRSLRPLQVWLIAEAHRKMRFENARGVRRGCGFIMESEDAEWDGFEFELSMNYRSQVGGRGKNVLGGHAVDALLRHLLWVI